MMNNIPFVSQVGTGANQHRNDCGPACALMVAQAHGKLLEMNVDQAYDLVAPAGDQYTSWGQLQQILRVANIDTEVQHDLGIGDLFEHLVARRTPICLVSYKVIKRYSRYPSSYTGAHFVVLVDMSPRLVTIHDPLTTPNLQLPIEAWLEAHESTKGNRLHYAALIETVGRPVIRRGISSPRDAAEEVDGG